MERDSPLEAEAAGVVPGHAEGRRRDLGRMDDRGGELPGDREGDAAASGPHVDEDGPWRAPQPVQSGLHDQLGLRTWDQDVGPDGEVVAPECLNAGEVLRRPPAGALVHEDEEAGRRVVGHGVGAPC